MDTILLLHIFCTFYLTGLIILIQLIHYPSFHYTDPARLLDFHDFHCKRIPFLVVPTMLGELFTGAYLWYDRPEIFWIGNFLSVLLIWIFTFTLSVPAHGRFRQDPTPKYIQHLVNSNWPRTITWVLRSACLLYWIFST
jgi:hypothetical protein